MVVRHGGCNALRGTIVLLRRQPLKYRPAVYFRKVGDFAAARRGATRSNSAFIHARRLKAEQARHPRASIDEQQRSITRPSPPAGIPGMCMSGSDNRWNISFASELFTFAAPFKGFRRRARLTLPTSRVGCRDVYGRCKSPRMLKHENSPLQ